MKDGRRFAKEVVATLRGEALCAPMPGLYREAPEAGARVSEGTAIGELEVLGVRHRVVAPAGTHGMVAPRTGRRLARRPVAYGEPLVVLEEAESRRATSSEASTKSSSSGALAFRAPMSGRYYAKPAPGAEPFVKVGDTIEPGRTVALLEVMKTFNRVQYGGASLPPRARVVAILPKDGDDVNAGDPLLELE
jgi:acetyl-CoA carboxylase biotin carboxyl carrier protein